MRRPAPVRIVALAWVVLAGELVAVALTSESALTTVAISVAHAMLVFCGSVIVFRSDRPIIGWMLVMMGVAFGARLALNGLHEAEALGPSGLGDVASFPALAVLVALIVLFPDGRTSRLGWHVVWSGAAVTALFTVASVTTLVTGQSELRSAITDLVPIVYSLLSLVAVGILAAFYRRRSDLERRQIRWFLSSIVVSVPLYVIPTIAGVSDAVFNLFDAAATSLYPLAILVAILRYRLYAIDQLISRTITYTIVIASLGLLYVAGVGLLPVVIPTSGSLPVALSTLAGVALFGPLLRRTRTAVDRRFNRSRYDATRIVDDFVAQIRNETDVAVILDQLTAAAARAVEPVHAGMWTARRFGSG